jgi:hypothetical protein
MQKHAIAVICLYPDVIWMEFINKITNYDIYLVIDDNTKNYNNIHKETYPNIYFVQIDNDECIKCGFQKISHTAERYERLTAWDKVLYFFSCINNSYENVWIFEDDLFFHNEKVLIDIDNKYPTSDLLSADLTLNGEWYHYGQLYNPIYNNIDELKKDNANLYHGLMCACRVSNQLFMRLKEFASKHTFLFFIEMCLPTLAKYNGLVCETGDVFSKIFYRHDFSKEDINKTDFFHPVKDINLHLEYRNTL